MTDIALNRPLGHQLPPAWKEQGTTLLYADLREHTEAGYVNSREQHAGDTSAYELIIKGAPIHHRHNAFRNTLIVVTAQSRSATGADLPADKALMLKRAVVRQINSLEVNAVKSILDLVRLARVEEALLLLGGLTSRGDTERLIRALSNADVY